MNLQRLTLHFQGHLTSYPIQADSLFGHLCWAIRDLQGKPALDQFLQAYKDNAPPLLLSNGFLEGQLPRPKLRPLTRQQMEDLNLSTELKPLKKITTIKRSVWEELTKEAVSEEILVKTLLAAKKEAKVKPQTYCKKCVVPLIPATKKEIEIIDIPHSVIDRLTQRTLNYGGLFHSHEYDFRGKKIDLYVHFDNAVMDSARLYCLLKYIGMLGYGKDKSTGKGAFTVDTPETWETIKLPTENINRVMSLSIGIPCKNLTEGYYNLVPKYGKLGGHWANDGQPFKHPILMHDAGSTYTPKEAVRPFYGQLLENMHSNKERGICHYAYLLVWPFKIVT